jgi:hypothetical protein
MRHVGAADILRALARGLVERGYMDTQGRRRQLALDAAWAEAKETAGMLSRRQFDAALEAAGFHTLLAVATLALDIAERKVYATLGREDDEDLAAVERMRETVARLGGGK